MPTQIGENCAKKSSPRSCLYRRFSWRSPFWVQTFWQLAVSIVPVGGDCAN
jgi:hypothetical protein